MLTPPHLQEPFLPVDSACVTAQTPVGADHAVARHDESDRVAPDRAPTAWADMCFRPVRRATSAAMQE